MLRLSIALLAVVALGLLAFASLRKPTAPPTEVTILSDYRSLKGANNRPRLLPHAGVDFGGPFGSPVIAAAAGVVTSVVDWPPGCGRGIVLSHPEFKRYTAYCHLQDVLVQSGQEVARARPSGASERPATPSASPTCTSSSARGRARRTRTATCRAPRIP